MTDKFNSLTVVLNESIREDEAVNIISAIMMLKGVLSVKGDVADIIEQCVAESRVRAEYQEKIIDTFFKHKDGEK